MYLFTYSKRCQQQQRKSPPVVIYLWKLIVDYMWFSFQYSLSICLFIQRDVNKSRWKRPPVFIYLWKLIVDYMWFSFQYSLSIYLFIQSDVNKSRWKRPPVFIYLCKSLVVRHGFCFNIQYLFIYLFKAMSTEAGGTDDLYLLMEITSCDTWFSFSY